ITVYSEPGQGTTFHVYLPVSQLRTDNKNNDQDSRPNLPGGKEHILLVDDEEAIIDIYRETLQTLGYTISTETSSKKALALFQTAPDSFDLVITDQTMPHLTGMELTDRMLEIRPDLPVILSSGLSETILKGQKDETGIRKFLTKPVTLMDLASGVREILDGK
ncbi:MAG: response regulator, partial [Desulfobulbaceae bacterium]|nr:response regulator [Desulfobulbaceae bacterium]